MFAEPVTTDSAAGPRPLWKVRDLVYGVLLLVASLLLVVVIAGVLGLSAGGDPPDTVREAALTIAFELLFGAAVVYLAFHRGLRLADLGFVRPQRWGPAVVAWLGAYFVLAGYALLLAALDAVGFDVSGLRDGNPLPVDGDRQLGALAIVLLGVAVVGVAPFAEELFFRALLFRGMRGYWGLGPSLAASGIAFGAFHINISVLVPFAGIGVLFAWANERSGSLWTSIAAHAAFNGASFALTVWPPT